MISNNMVVYIGVFAFGELVALGIFVLVLRIFRRGPLKLSGVVSGMLERFFLFVTLLNNLPHALAFFGALKIATRLKDESKISNEYFLAGNLISVLLAIAYFIVSGYLINR
jgi:hypothetical protein